MERLTHTNKGMAWYKSDLLLLEPCELSYSQVGEVLRRLAAYEDTGLEPDMITGLVLYAMRKGATEIETFAGIPGPRICELARADKAGRVLDYVPGDTVYDRFGMAWTVTTAEIHKFEDGQLRYLYRCGHPGTDDYRALYSDEIQPPPEGRQVCPECEKEAGA